MSEDGGISAQEWLAIVDSDPELSLEPGGKYFALWAGPSKHPDPWFDWWRGAIQTKNPDPPMIEKMIRIAAQLTARVQGDDGEIDLPGGRVEKDGMVDDRAGMDWREW
jgi:hypothetical protein